MKSRFADGVRSRLVDLAGRDLEGHIICAATIAAGLNKMRGGWGEIRAARAVVGISLVGGVPELTKGQIFPKLASRYPAREELWDLSLGWLRDQEEFPGDIQAALGTQLKKVTEIAAPQRGERLWGRDFVVACLLALSREDAEELREVAGLDAVAMLEFVAESLESWEDRKADADLAGILARSELAGPSRKVKGPDVQRVDPTLETEVKGSVDVGQRAQSQSSTDSGAASGQATFGATTPPDPDTSPVRSGFSADTAEDAVDRLKLKGDVQALSRLLVDANVVPPLSVGLVGDWGSGKSFFMRLVRERITKQLCKPKNEQWACQNVVHVPFNAWHYADANLWANLVTHIFGKLAEATSPSKEEGEIVKAREAVLQELAKAGGALSQSERRVDEAKVALGLAQETAATAKMNLRLDDTALQKLRAAAEELGYGQVFHDVEDVVQEFEKVRRLGISSERHVGGLLKGLGPGLLVGVLVFLLFAVLYVYLPDNEWVQRISEFGATLGSALATVVAAVKNASGRLSKFEKALRATREAFSESQLEELSKYEAACADVEQKKRRVSALERELVELSAERRLVSFIEERSAAEDYKSQLGIVSLIRKDFERLSKLMKEAREGKRELQLAAPRRSLPHVQSRAEGDEKKTKKPVQPEKPVSMKAIDRIILYVDDLDRCRPERVVEILEAVHLLLALDLFVVVVAVDPRWLLRSLSVVYSELLGKEDGEMDAEFRSTTPQQYLEKIFQIPYAVRPMTKDGLEEYAKDLARAPARGGAAVGAGAAAGETTETTDGDGAAPKKESQEEEGDKGEGKEDEEAAKQLVTPDEGADGGDGTEGEEEGDEGPPPKPLVIGDDEVALITRFHRLLPTPRVAKRVVNLYRLVVASSDTRSAHFDPKDCEVVLALLCIQHGTPAIAVRIFEQLCTEAMGAGDLGSSLNAMLPDLPDAPLSELQRHQKQQLERSLTAAELEIPLQVAGKWAPKIARYSFMTGQHWAEWMARSERV